MNKRGHSAFSTTQKKRNVPNKERGFILVSVIIAITLVAAIAFALSQQGASETNVTSGELERDHLRYVAEAGMAHARLQLAKNTSCSGYTDIPKTDFGTDSYKAKFKTDEGSPVTVVATGSLGSSAEFKLQSDAVRVYQPPTAAVLQLGKTAGKDVHIDSFYDNNNYGGQADVTVRSDPGWIQRPLLEFDLSAIPTGVRIVSAKLELKLAVLTKPGVIGVHRLTRSWEEGTGKGTGNADGATWLEYDGANLWAQPGGELASTVYGSTTAGSGKLGQWVSWEIGDLVDEWVSGKSANYGLALVGDGIVDNAKFESRENPDPAVAPKLTIVFACECGKTCAGPPAPGYLDEFNNQTCDPAFDYSGSDGALDWSPWLWTEVNESDGSCAGQIQVAADSTIPDPESFRLRVIGQGVRVYRTVDLSGLTQPTLSFAYRLLNYPLDDFLRIRVSTNGGTDWTELARFTGPFDHTEYQSASYDLSAFIDVDTLIQFEFNGVSAALTSYIDNVHIVEAGSGLIAHWKFDDGSGLTALDSEGGHDGTLLNGPAWVPGKLDTALDFDGSDDVVEVPQASDLDLSTFTVAAWIRISAITSSQTILEKRDGADLATVNYLLLAAGNEITWAFYDGGWASFSTDAANMEVDTWYHVAGTYDNSTGEGNVYVNGVLLATGTTTKNPPLVPGTVRIGDSECAACDDKWNGSLDDVRIYNRALSASEVADLAASGSGPIAHWKLDDGTGLTALDSVGGHDGTLLNGPSWGTGMIDGGLSFDNSNDYVNVPHDDALSLSSLTISAWMNRTTQSTVYDTIVLKKQQSNYWLYAYDDEIGFSFNDVGWVHFMTPAANLTTDEWYHVAVTFDDMIGEANIYVDGALSHTGTTVKRPVPNSADLFIGGDHLGGYPWPGTLDDIRLYDYAMSAAEISDLFATGSGGGYYLDEFNSLNCDPASDYTGSDGSLDWSGFQWQETLDDSGSCSGDIRILVDGGSNRLQLKGDGSGIERRVDLSAFSVATLSFDYLQDGSFDATRYLSVWASADAGSNWTEVGRIDVEGDGTYTSASFDISAYVGPNAMIRFETADLQATRKIYIDNIHIDDVPTGGGGGGGGGEVTFEEYTDASLSSDGLSITIPKPASTAAGDLLIAAIVTDGENKPAMTAPAGWTLIDHGRTSKQVTMDVLWKIADASEPGSYDFSWVKSQQAYAWIMRFTGHHPTAPIHDSQSDGGTSSNPVSPAVSTTITNTMIVRIGGFDDDDITPGDPGLSGHTAVTMGASDTGTGTASGGAGYVLQSGTGGSGTSTFSLTNSEEYRAVTIAIAPAP